jgi:CheY-like chemotaxis protein
VREKGLAIQLKATRKDFWISVDDDLLSQIMDYLLDNAVKFSESGTIVVSCTEEPSAISIIDQGIGIEQNQINDIFKPLHQLQDPYTKDYGGMGAGLFLAKSLCERMGFGISITSTPGVGTKVVIGIPEIAIIPGADRQAVDRSTPTRSINTILIVEDELINALFLKTILAKWGYDGVPIAMDGPEAIQACENQTFDLILTDIGLPKMSGIDVIAWIRKKQANKNIKILAVTAHASDADQKKILDAGADAVLTKPYRAEQLSGKLKEIGVNLKPRLNS